MKNTSLSQKIKIIQAIRGFSEKKIAEKIGISQQSLNKKLKKEYPDIETLKKISEVLDFTIEIKFKLNDTGEEV